MVARLVRNEKVRGSNPLSSTTDKRVWLAKMQPFSVIGGGGAQLFAGARHETWHLRRMQPSMARRLWPTREVTAGLLLALAVAGMVSTLALTWYRLSMRCRGYDDEGIVLASRSMQGRLICSDNGLGTPRITLLVAVGVVLWLLALVVWLRSHRFTWLVPLLVVVVASPALTAVVATRLPGACTKAQRQEFGKAACERNLEMILEGLSPVRPSTTSPASRSSWAESGQSAAHCVNLGGSAAGETPATSAARK